MKRLKVILYSELKYVTEVMPFQFFIKAIAFEPRVCGVVRCISSIHAICSHGSPME